MDQRVVDGKTVASPTKRGPNRQVFVGGYVSPELAERFKALAKAYGMSVNALIVSMIEEKVRKDPKQQNGDHNV
jgi:hypothetical protein